MQKSVRTGTPKRVKILDYQYIGFGHPAMDIWSIVYSATDSEYRANHLEGDLQAYYDVLSGYMDTRVDYAEFRHELEERRTFGMVQVSAWCLVTLSPVKLPSLTKEHSKFESTLREMLSAEDTAEDHPDLREGRRRLMSNMKEMETLGLI